MFSAPFSLIAQNEILRDTIIDILLKYSIIYEPNPVHERDNLEIYNLFATVLVNKNTYSPEQRENLRIETFKTLYAHARSWSEDIPDEIRINMRRKLIYMTLALLSPDQDKYDYFLKCAKKSLDGILITPEEFHQNYVLIRLQKILMLLDSNYDEAVIIKYELSKLSKYINDAALPSGFLDHIARFLIIRVCL